MDICVSPQTSLLSNNTNVVNVPILSPSFISASLYTLKHEDQRRVNDRSKEKQFVQLIHKRLKDISSAFNF